MATTKVKAIYSSPVAVLDYVLHNKSGMAIDADFEIEDISDAIDYAIADKTGEITYRTMTTHHNCSAGKEKATFRRDIANAKAYHNSNKGNRTKNGKEVVCYHLIQSFDGHETTPETANEIGLKLARKVFGNHAVTVSTHTNTKNVHNHLVICAWDKDGRKWHDCRDTKRLIRQESDRLCEEYGLSVLEHTRDMALKTYTDVTGKKRSVEVTARKKAMWIKYDKGITGIAAADDYRSSDAHAKATAFKQSNRESVKEDIEILLPQVSSYEELLDKLRDMGYEIKDKRVDGSWREHITFLAPGQAKGVRDGSLGKDGFCRRENLEKHIATNVANRAKENAEPVIDTHSHNEPEIYGGTDTYNHENNRRVAPDGSYVLRSGIEGKIIIDTNEMQSDLAAANKHSAGNFDYITLLRNQIRDNLKTLSFIENNRLHSYEQINRHYELAYDSYRMILPEVSKLGKDVSRLEFIAGLIEKKDTPASVLESYGLNSASGRDRISEEMATVTDRIAELIPVIEHAKDNLRKCELCIKTLDRIDRKHGSRDEKAMKEHYKIRAKVYDMEGNWDRAPRTRDYER